MIKCACGGETCPIRISFDDSSHLIWFTDKNNEDCTMYLDANTTVALIKRLQEFLRSFYKEED